MSPCASGVSGDYLSKRDTFSSFIFHHISVPNKDNTPVSTEAVTIVNTRPVRFMTFPFAGCLTGICRNSSRDLPPLVPWLQ